MSAFAGVANANENPRIKDATTRIVATFFVANTLLIVCFELFIPLQFLEKLGRNRTPHPFDEELCKFVCFILNNPNNQLTKILITEDTNNLGQVCPNSLIVTDRDPKLCYPASFEARLAAERNVCRAS